MIKIIIASTFNLQYRNPAKKRYQPSEYLYRLIYV